ncbi:hypothetical protein F5887DRAFT_479390 [Amanita rubescens]|nr:hypothetical protein F5887DRAFT_625336 [Amanita rubescens]KAF8314164.1 hypothetical protein F5887DRAFT_479390 [Amanita rubescens]
MSTLSSADSTRFLTNREFSDQEKTYIRKLLLHATNELRDVEEQIVIAQLNPRLTCRQAKLKLDISRYKVALAPHKMLPEHILQLIFQWCIPPDGLHVPSPRHRELVWPSFTWVCSSWRKLAMNTPELWRDVTMQLYNDYYNRRRINLAFEWLSRAGDMPRSLEIKAQSRHDPWAEAIDQLVVPFKFRSLDLTLTRVQFHKLLSLPPQAQSLHTLRLVAAALFPLAAYEDCSTYSLITTLRWSQLRHLCIDSASISASILINALGNCLVLEELWMVVCPDRAPCNAPPSFITLPNLRRLTLHFIIGSNPKIFFRLLILPQIENLAMSMTNARREMPGCTSLHFADMAQRSGMSRIQKLCLGKGMEPYRLVDLLKYAPSLSFLKVNGDVVFDSQTLEEMSTGQLAPNIRTLYLPEVGDSLRILEMVWTRFQNVRRDTKSEVSVSHIMEVHISVPPAADVVEFNGWVDKLGDLGIFCLYYGYTP